MANNIDPNVSFDTGAQPAPDRFSSGVRRNWEDQAFDHLFDRRLQGAPLSTPAVNCKEDSSIHSDFRSLATPGRVASDSSDTATSPVTAATDMSANSFSGAAASNLAGNVNRQEALAPGMSVEPIHRVRDASGEMQEIQPGLEGSPRSAATGTQWPERSVVVGLTTEGARIWIRDPRLRAGAADLNRRVRLELGWLGVALASLIVNGHSA